MTIQEKFKDKVLFIKDEQMFKEVTELLKGVKAEFSKAAYFLSRNNKESNYLIIEYDFCFLGEKYEYETELTYDQFKELLKD